MKQRASKIRFQIDQSRLSRAGLLLLLLILFSSTSQAQAELKADSNHVETGNPFVFQLLIPANLGKPDSINFEAWKHLLPPQNIVSQTDWAPEGQKLSKRLTALFFDEDTVQIPALPIAFRNGDTVYSNPFQLIVNATPSPDDLNDMALLKDIHREPVLWTDYLPWILGALGLLALIGLLYWMANRQKKTRIQSRLIEAPPHELALKKLEALSKKQLTTHGLVKEHYAELTYILREYLEKRFAIPALESTSLETLERLKDTGFDPQLSQPLQTLLEQADLAKFAKIIPEESFQIESMALSKTIILETSAPENPITQ